MSERDDSFSDEKHSPPRSNSKLTSTIIDSIKIFFRNKRIFLTIFLFLTLPLSLLLSSLSFSSRPLKAQIYHLEALAAFSHTRFEARHVWKESRAEALSLLRLKSLFFLPSFLLSLLSCPAAVASASLSYQGRRPSLISAFSAVKTAWKRLSVTAIVVYALLLLYAQVPPIIAAPFRSEPGLRLAVLVAASGFEIYLMAVMDLALVVSVVEERFGWEAIRAGSDVMEGRKVAGWALSASFVLVSGFIGYKLEGLMEDQDISTLSWLTVVIERWDAMVLVVLYGMEVLWCYVVTTVFYCECKKRHVMKGEEGSFVSV